jgi:DNA-binding NarL/FixJ family response regulator
MPTDPHNRAAPAAQDPGVIRVMCVDDHPIFREGLAAVLANDPGFELVAEAGTGEEAIEKFRRYRPDVTLMDLRLPGISGAEAITAIRAEFPQARIVVLTTETGDVPIQRTLTAGAKGYVLKGMAMSELLEIIRSVHAGKTKIPDRVATHIAEHITAKNLSARELQVLKLIASGHRNREVAQKLAISEETVKMHVRNIMVKLNANDRTHAVTIAVRRGFITL